MEYDDHPELYSFSEIRAEDRSFTRVPNVEPSIREAITKAHQQHQTFGPWRIIAYLRQIKSIEVTLDEVLTVLNP